MSENTSEGATIGPDAQVSDRAYVFGQSRVSGHASVSGSVVVSGHAQVTGHAVVYGRAVVRGMSQIWDNAAVFGDAEVYGYARVGGSARVFGNARVHGVVSLKYGWVGQNADVFLNGHVIFLDGVFNEGVTVYRTVGGGARVQAGCQNFDLFTPFRELSDLARINDWDLPAGWLDILAVFRSTAQGWKDDRAED